MEHEDDEEVGNEVKLYVVVDEDCLKEERLWTVMDGK